MGNLGQRPPQFVTDGGHNIMKVTRPHEYDQRPQKFLMTKGLENIEYTNDSVIYEYS